MKARREEEKMAFFLFRKAIRKVPGKVIRAVPLPQPEILEGFGMREQIGEICKAAGYQSVLLVTDRNVYMLGFTEKAESSLKEAGIRCTVFKEIDSEPTAAIIRSGKVAAALCGADCIVAIGGGSVLDASKIIAAAGKRPIRRADRYLHKFAYVKGKTLPLITVPSTAGTGAENTVGAVVKDSHGVKHSTVVVGLNITNVILDSELTLNAPQSVTVWCGIDALSHGLEGLLSDTDSSEEDLEKSRECVKLCMENLPVLLKEPRNPDARLRMCEAADLGGNAINKQLAGYVHAFAHSIGALYHLPHGQAIAHCILPVTADQKEICREKLAALSVYCGFAEKDEAPAAAAEKYLEKLTQLLKLCGLQKGCDALKQDDYPKLLKMINADSINYSPSKTLRDEEILALLDQIRKGDLL